MRIPVATDTMPTGVKLLRETEVGVESRRPRQPRDAFVPVRTAELFWKRWDIDAVWTLETDASMRRRLTPQAHGFQRLGVRLIERGHAAGEEVLRDASGHVRIAGTLDIDAVWIWKLVDLDAEAAQLHKHMDPMIACTPCRAKAQAPMQPPRE